MPKIIRIDPVEDFFTISWIMHLRCNYDCMYCPPARHNDDGSMHSLADLQKYWQQIYDKTRHQNKRYKFSFTGGEVTINRDFLPFVQWLRQNYGEIVDTMGMTTNGSASLNYYRRAFEHLNFISFSTHTEHMDEDRFWATALELSKLAREGHKRTFMVNIMQEYWAHDQINRWVGFCEQNNIYHSVNPVLYQYKTRNHPIFQIRHEPSDA